MLKKKTILIVDDNEGMRDVLSIFVKRLGYQAESKKDAISAQKWLSANQPSLMLIDIMLPDITGIELCRWISCQENIKNIPIIHITALADDITQEDSMFSGAKDFITKPIDLKILEKKIKTLLGEKT